MCAAAACWSWPSAATTTRSTRGTSSSLSLALFDQTRAIHGLGDREREWLDYAALMHDIGSHISFGRHHRHSYYLITNGDLRGFQPEEIEIIALVARYHRRSTPKTTHEEYARLASGRRRTVRILAAMLRVAENLDRSHSQVITGLTVRARKDTARLELVANGDAELEMWATGRHIAPFEEVVGQPVRLVMTRPAATPRQKRASPAPPSGAPGVADTATRLRWGIRAEHGLVYAKFT